MTPPTPAWAVRHSPDRAVADEQRERVGGRAGLVHEPHRFRGDQRRLLGRLGDHRVAGGEGCGDLAGEYGDREVPRADADHHAERPVGGVGESAAADASRVVAQEVDRLADVAQRVGQRLAGFAANQAGEPLRFGLEARRCGDEDVRALRGRPRRPGRGGARGGGEGALDVVAPGVDDPTDNVAGVGGVDDRSRRRAFAASAPIAARAVGERLGQRGEARLVGEVEPGRIGARREKEIAGRGDLGMRRADRRERAGRRDRVFDQRFDRHGGVGDAIDEGGVGAVLEQTAHQIGEQRFMRADRGVDAARPAVGRGADDLVVERLAHAVQALELILSGVEVLAGHGAHRRQRQRVVGGELRVDRVGGGEQPLGAGEIGDVGVDLAREDGEALQPLDLRALDLAIPIGALDQPQHDAPLGGAREVDDPVDDGDGALLIGLNYEADAVPRRHRPDRGTRSRAGRATGRAARLPPRRC